LTRPGLSNGLAGATLRLQAEADLSLHGEHIFPWGQGSKLLQRFFSRRSLPNHRQFPPLKKKICDTRKNARR